ncbi:MAG: Na+/H+ antiporter subunit B [Bacteroidia bacterium]
MNSLILSVSAKLIVPVMLLFSVYLLARGHHLPGGGFAGGLMGGAALVLYAFATNVKRVLRRIRFSPVTIISAGLLIAFASGLPAIFQGQPFLTGLWLNWEVPFLPVPGTPLFFDMGVYLCVIGTVLLIIFPNIQSD